MDVVQTLILSAIEGITEFLPVSSTGHLILASHALAIPPTEFTKSFEIIIQLGAILAVVALYFKTLLQKKDYWPKLFVAFLPTAIIGFTLYPLIKSVLLTNPIFTLLALAVGGAALIIIELIYKEKANHSENLSQITYQQAVLIGCFQSLSVIPGVSRAAATILGGMLTGVKRTTSVEFSFLLAIPTILAASGLDVVKSHAHFNQSELVLLLIGFAGSFIFALVAVKYFISYIKSHTFVPFGIYRIVLSIIYFLIIVR